MFCGLIHWNVPRISTLLDNTVGTARNHHGGQVATLFAVWLPFHVYLGERSKTFSVCFYYVKLSIDSVLFPDGTYQFVHVHGLHGQNGHYTFLTFDGSQLFDGFSPEIIAVTSCGDAIFLEITSQFLVWLKTMLEMSKVYQKNPWNGCFVGISSGGLLWSKICMYVYIYI
jgi:hypothetical protein